MKSKLFSFFLCSILCFAMTLSIQGLERSEKAELVVHHGTVYTVDPKMPVAQAVAVADGRIVFVGDDEDAKKWIGDGTQLLDLKGRVMTPGFIEGHGHILAFGYARMRLDLSSAKNYRELVGLVAEAVKNARKGEWILGTGWHQSKWDEPPEPMVKGFQTHELLSGTTFHEAASRREAIALYKTFLREGKLKIRLWVMIDGRDETLVREWFAQGPEIGSGNHFLTIRAVKLFADGALGSRGAWLLAPYADRPGHFGHPTMEMELENSV